LAPHQSPEAQHFAPHTGPLHTHELPLQVKLAPHELQLDVLQLSFCPGGATLHPAGQ
jgi:hypothetical protein